MAGFPSPIRTLALILLGWGWLCVSANAQAVQPSESATTLATADKPIPDIPNLMRDVETNQRKSEAIEKDYLYHSVETAQEVDGHGQTKKTTVTEYDIYWANGVRV